MSEVKKRAIESGFQVRYWGQTYTPRNKFEEGIWEIVGAYIDRIPDRIEVHNRWPRSLREKGLLFYGPPGSGKTLLAHTVLQAVALRSYSIHAFDFFEYIEMKRKEMDSARPVEERQELMEIIDKIEYEKSQYMLVDDIGKEYTGPTSWAPQMFHHLMRRRGGAMLPTLVTTNLSLEEIGRHYGEAALSHLHEVCVLIPTGEEDFRRQ